MTPWLAPEIAAALNANATRRERSRHRYGYYHRDTTRFFQRCLEENSRVLIVGCDVAPLTAQLKAADVVAFDLLRNEENLADVLKAAPYDYVLLPNTLHFLKNIQTFLDVLRTGLAPHARVVALQYNFLWAPLYKAAEWIGIKTPMPSLNWLSAQDTRNFLQLAGFEPVQGATRCLVPFSLFGLGPLINTVIAPLPGIAHLGQKLYAIARPRPLTALSLPRVSIVVPARNEAGNIAPLLDRLPVLGEHTEVLFVEGHSKDDTWGEIRRQVQSHPRRGHFELKTFQQTGRGKADAVRLGFAQATGDVLMILDADLSVQPEDLPLFYRALAQGTTEFANGSRLVYNMESQAMQLLNLFFNKLFGLWISWIIGQPVKDTLCGTKVMTRRNYERMQRVFARWAGRDPFGDFDLLFGAARLSLKIRDVPIAYKERTYGNTNISRFRNGWQLLKMCLVFWPEFKR